VVSDLPNLGKSLVGYLTPADAAEDVDIERVRNRVAAALPEYMTPAAYVVIDEIPITAHGKIDRAALPEPEVGSGADYREPADGTERRVADLFAELLGRDRVGADDSFFDLGGHSLLATKLVAAVRSQFNVDIGVREVFELGTVARVAERIDSTSASDSNRPRMVAIPREGPLQMSASQLRMWFQYRIDGPGPVNNIPFAARITGPCDVDAFVAAVGDVVARHEILRTTYREIDGVPYQIVNEACEVAVRRARGDDDSWLQAELARETAARLRPRARPADPGRGVVDARGVCGVTRGASHRRRPLVGDGVVHRPAGRVPGQARRSAAQTRPAAGAVRRLRRVADGAAGRHRWTRRDTARLLARAARRPTGGPRSAHRFPAPTGVDRGGGCRRVRHRQCHARQVRPPEPGPRCHRVHAVAVGGGDRTAQGRCGP
jgi:acyl carrier protein